jgi:VWFA-related protein
VNKLLLPAFFLAAAIVLAAAPLPRMVNLTVTATDGRGQPVGDLTKADFALQDSGKDQSIAWFHFNAPKPHAAISHATLVILDLLNADITERGFASDEIVRSLQGREASDFVYLYLLTPDTKLYPVHPLPNSAADVARQATPWTKQIRPLLDDALKNANRLRPSGLTEDVRIKMTHDALGLAVSTLAMLPGQKNIVWISRGVPISVRLASGGEEIDFRPMVRRLSEACRQAKVTMYTVNPSASATPSEGQLSSTETLQQIANLTGGRLFTGNNIAKAIAQASEDWRASYTIGYVPSAENWDGKLHKIKLSTPRHGVELQFPTGYYADPRDRATEQMRAALQAAISSPFDSTEMGLSVTASRAGKTPGAAQFKIRVDYADALVAEQANRYTANLVVTFVDYTSKGPKSVSAPAGLQVSMTEEQRAAAMKDGILVTEDHPLGEGVERVRVIVYDPAANLLGSLIVTP